MHMRFLTTTVIALTLIFSQGGSFLVAAMCPHLTSKVGSCESPDAPEEMDHHEMGHGQMDSVDQEPSPIGFAASPAVIESITDCNHCTIHSRTDSKASLRDWSIPQRSSDRMVSLPVTTVAPAATSSEIVLTSRAHGPPGSEVSRYILVNVFRI